MSREALLRVLNEEAAAILALASRLDSAFTQAVEEIANCRGRVIPCGIGKSGHVAQKFAATLASTGSPAFFLHAAEAVHGDLGMVTDADIVMPFTYSGETDEIVRLFPSFRAQGARTIVVTGRPKSSAGREADLILDVSVEREACPNNLAPTTSTTVMLAASDALAVAVMETRGFRAEDFARFHPAGSLGRRLLLRVSDVLRPRAEIAVVEPGTPIVDVIRKMTAAGVGAACVVQGDALVGIVSESDLRRFLGADGADLRQPAELIANRNPATIEPELLAMEALEMFQNFPVKIGEIPVVEDGRLIGLLVLKDLLRSGIV